MGGIPQVSRCPWLADYLAGFPGVTTDYKAEWGFLHYRVGGRIFAIICTPDARYKEHAGRSLVTLRCDGRMSEGLREQYADIVPGFYADHRFWISVYLDGEVPDDTLRALCAHSYDEAFSRLSKRTQRKISKLNPYEL